MLNLFRQSFKKANIVESTRVLSNPYRGMYQIFTVSLNEEVDLDHFKSCLIPTENLVLLIADIGAYKDKMLDKEAVGQLDCVIDFFSTHNKKLIFRPVYDHEGHGEEREPDSFEMVKSHIDVIADTVAKHSGSIFVFQGLLVGNWGEMHGSKYLGKGHIRELVDILDSKLAGKVYLSVRKPVQYRKLRAGYDFSEKECKIGFFDDAILASDTDLGTYGVSEATDWEKAWAKEAELTFEKILCLSVPNGGETIYGEGFSDKLFSRDIITTLSKMRLTYLNRLYDRKVLDRWNSMVSGTSGKWKASSLYSYIEAHLGYRYVIERIDGKRNGNSLSLEICIANTGFAPAYNDIELKINVLTDCDWKSFDTSQLMSGIMPSCKNTYIINIELNNNIGSVTKYYAQMSCVEDGTNVQFGNESDTNGVYLGEMLDYTVRGLEK